MIPGGPNPDQRDFTTAFSQCHVTLFQCPSPTIISFIQRLICRSKSLREAWNSTWDQARSGKWTDSQNHGRLNCAPHLLMARNQALRKKERWGYNLRWNVFMQVIKDGFLNKRGRVDRLNGPQSSFSQKSFHDDILLVGVV